MRKIDLLQVLKSMAKKCWLPILLAVIGAGCMFAVVKMQQDEPTITWTLNNRYVISISDRQDYDSYLYEEKMAAVINELLVRDEELCEMCGTLSAYSTKVFNRRLELILQGKDKETLVQLERFFCEKAQTYLSEECVQDATFTMESTLVNEEELIRVPPSKKMILLGALLGLSAGLAVLLLTEYIKSPKL